MVWLLATAHALAPSESFYFRDHALIFQRLLHLVRAAYQSGTMPLWDPFVGGGEQLAAYPAAMAFSPLATLFLLPLEHFAVHDLFVCSFLLLAGLSAERLALTLGLSPPARALAGAAYMLCGPILSSHSLLPLLQVSAVLPLLLAALVHHLRAPTTRSMLLLAGATAWEALTLEPYSLLGVIVLAGAASVEWLTAETFRWRPLWIAARSSALALLVAVALSAVAWLPLVNLVREGSRGRGFSPEDAARFSVHPARLLELILPGLSGDAMMQGELFAQDGGSA